MAEVPASRAAKVKGRGREAWKYVHIPEPLHRKAISRAHKKGISLAMFVKNAVEAHLKPI